MKYEQVGNSILTRRLLLQSTRGARVVTTAQKKLNVAINGFGRIGESRYLV